MIAIVNYSAGNTRSVQNALQKLACEFTLTSDPEVLQTAEKVIFPGVGAAQMAMRELHRLELVPVLKNLNQPFLGICLGMQLMGSHSEEGNVEGLGIVPARVLPFEGKARTIHTGWNTLQNRRETQFWQEVDPESDMYFVHGYWMELGDFVLAEAEFEGQAFAAAIQHQNFYGVQFHPEKSGEPGQKILQNFLDL